MTISVAIVEDDPGFRDTFCTVVRGADDMCLHSMADDLPSGLELLNLSAADVLLVDLGLPSGSGIKLIEQAQVRWPQCDVMVISVFGDKRNVLSAIRAGAAGYLLKDTPTDQLAEQIRVVHRGGSAITPVIARQMLNLLAKQVEAAPSGGASGGDKWASAVLTRQEQQVLVLANKGYKYEEVGRIMGISRHTVMTYVKRCYRKLHVNSKTGAIYEAQRLGVVFD